MSSALSRELAAFVESGVSILVGTRDGRLIPENVRVFGARVERGRHEVTVFLAAATSATTRANLADNGRIAVCFARIEDHRSIQLKGRMSSLRPATADERALVERYRAAFFENLARIGLPPRITLRLASWPAFAVRFRVEEIYVQTPGPGAGAPLEPEPEGAGT